MLRNFMKRIFAITMISITILAIKPISAYAEWRSVADKWYFRDGDIYAKGWKQINNKWYYFDDNGIMSRNKMVDGYYITGSGVAVSTTTTKNLPIRIPADWVKLENKKDGTYIMNGRAAFVYATDDISAYSESSYIDDMKQALKNDSMDVQVTHKTFNGKNAECLEYEITTDDSRTLKSDLIIFFQNNKAYAFCVASDPEYFKDSKQELEDILNYTLTI